MENLEYLMKMVCRILPQYFSLFACNLIICFDFILRWCLAGGFCKAEAIGVFYLQKAKDAKRVYAKVINVRSNHDGTKRLFLSPHGPSQAKLLEMIYQQSNVDIDSVSWIEAHATGTLVRYRLI